METNRRDFLKMGGLGLLAFNLNGVETLLTPRQARAENVPFQVLTEDEAATLEAFGDTLAIGAAEAGIAHFVDQQLAAKPEDSLLMIRYLDVPPPHDGFYKLGLGNLNRASQAVNGKPFAELDADARTAFVGSILKEQPAQWQGPPAQFFYFVVRSDAVDVVYGTVEGFEKLDVPYMPHIQPASNW